MITCWDTSRQTDRPAGRKAARDGQKILRPLERLQSSGMYQPQRTAPQKMGGTRRHFLGARVQRGRHPVIVIEQTVGIESAIGLMPRITIDLQTIGRPDRPTAPRFVGKQAD